MPTTIHVNDAQGMVFFIESQLKTGVKELDYDNDKLFKIIDTVNKELQTGPYSKEKVNDLCLSLISFASKHFEIEEKVLRKTNINPEILESHLIEHKSFLDRIKGMLINSSPMFEILRCLSDWLNHIQNEDVKFFKETQLA